MGSSSVKRTDLSTFGNYFIRCSSRQGPCFTFPRVNFQFFFFLSLYFPFCIALAAFKAAHPRLKSGDDSAVRMGSNSSRRKGRVF